AGHPAFIHGAGPSQSEHLFRSAEAAAADASSQLRRPHCSKPTAIEARVRVDAGNHLARLARYAYRTHAVAPADVEHLLANRRMQMKVVVRVDVVERQTGGTIGRELRFDFRGKLPPNARPQEHVDANHHQVVA